MADDSLLKELGTSKNGHAIFAPSGSASWLNCSGSLLVNARSGDSAGYEAAEGTIAHELGEEWNKTGERPEYMLGKIRRAQAGGVWFDVEVTSDMFYHVGRYVQWCQELPGDHYFETKVDISPLLPIPNQRGTADHFVCRPRVLIITDLKYGTGVRVYAEGNTQALLYASGVFMEWDWIYGFETIIIRICQPRLDVFETWEITRKQLIEFMEFVRVRSREAWQENAPRSPSIKACRWCAGFERCPARIKMLDDVIDEMFDSEDLDGEDPKEFSKTYTAQELQGNTKTLAGMGNAAERLDSIAIKDISTKGLAYVHSFRSHFETWFKHIGEELLDRAEKGHKIPFHYLSEGRTSRRYKDRDEARKTIQDTFHIEDDEIAPRKMVTVKKLEGLIRTHSGMKPQEVAMVLEPLINKVRSKRTLQLMLDDRPEADDLEDDFEAED